MMSRGTHIILSSWKITWVRDYDVERNRDYDVEKERNLYYKEL